MLVLLPALVGALSLSAAPPAHCELHEASGPAFQWEGSCGPLFDRKATLRLTRAKSITTGRWRADAAPSAVWSGAVNEGMDSVEVEIYQGGAGLLRTQKGWFPVSGFVATAEKLAFDVDGSRKIEPTSLDAEIVRHANMLLSSDAVWNRADDRKCPPSATTWSIYCAMEHATIEVTCGFHHRRPAMELVRQIIEKRSAGRNYEHRLMDYNNDKTTTLADVRAIFNEALSQMGATGAAPVSNLAGCT